MTDKYVGVFNDIDDGFETENSDWDVEYNSAGSINPGLCNKMKDYEDCPFNMMGRACLDCDVIVVGDSILESFEHVDFTSEEE